MKNRILKLLFIGLGIVFLSQCTEKAAEENNHPDGWADAGSENFHGLNVKSSGSVGCFTCHGDDNNGGNTGISCYDCHTGGPSGHPDSTIWLNPQNDNFHGNSVADAGPVVCADCHGTDYTGGTSLQSCYSCHAGGPSGHPATSIWVGDQTSESFHGNVIIANGWDDCTSCHGDDYLGGTSEQSCYTCHAGGRSGHPASADWLDQSSDDYHGKIFWDNGWDFTDCQTCHGSSYDGGIAEVSCGSCHTGSSSELFNCSSCHGSSGGYNPPEGIMGETASTDLSVGAHEAHLNGGTYSNVIQCNECHVVPETWDADGHLGDDNRAEIMFGDLATANGTLTPTYDSETGTCSNVYCHGNFQFGSVAGNNADMIWNSAEGVSCTTCHNIAPDGHFGNYTEVTQCSSCHSDVIDAEGNIIDKSLHINGDKNVY